MPTYDSDAGWDWHDAAIIAVGRVLPDGETEQYSIGAVDLYSNAQTGDPGGSYLSLGTFDDIDEAASFYHDLQGDIHDRELLPFQLIDFANEKAVGGRRNAEPASEWRGAGDMEYAAYEEMRSLNAPTYHRTIWIWRHCSAWISRQKRSKPIFKALRDIGIVTEDFDPKPTRRLH